MTETLFRHPMEIQFRHCDPAGLVYYPRLIDEAEGAVEAWLGKALDEHYRQWIYERRLGLPRAKVVCEFARPSWMGDRLELVLRLPKVGRSSIEILVEGRGEGEADPRFTITLVLVNMSLDTNRAVPFDDSVRAKFDRYHLLSKKG